MVDGREFAPPDEIRRAFSAAMSVMYREEVSAYGDLADLVVQVNSEVLANTSSHIVRSKSAEEVRQLSEERHGAIRIGRADELAMLRRAFAVMGMFPVGYYDLTEAGVPMHSTAFRPVDAKSLKANPFRIFASLLRLDLIKDQNLRRDAEAALGKRDIFTNSAVDLIEKAEKQRGLTAVDAARLVAELLETFRWHSSAPVEADLYHRLHNAHRLVADVVCFRGPHINHLTPRTLNIDLVQQRMPAYGMTPKAVIEGPPRRRCPILLRQTSFKALEEPVWFANALGGRVEGKHTARFGEVEERGIALTPKGRSLYDECLQAVRKTCAPAADGSNSMEYAAALENAFAAFPDSWEEIRRQKLGYFSYRVKDALRAGSIPGRRLSLDSLVEIGAVEYMPIVYEDFLPVSAAGIFQSNLGDEGTQTFNASPNQRMFEAFLGNEVLNEFEHYSQIEQASIHACMDVLQDDVAA